MKRLRLPAIFAIAVAIALVPFLVSAASVALGEPAPAPVATFRGFDLTPLIGALLLLVSGVITWVGKRISAAQAASAETSRAEKAALQLAEVATMLADRAWVTLAPTVQTIIADGNVTAEERAQLESVLRRILDDSTQTLVSKETLEGIASALGLPFAGLVARLASSILGIFVKAHTPENREVEAGQFPVYDPSSFGG
jgi:hypothetical protein